MALETGFLCLLKLQAITLILGMGFIPYISIGYSLSLRGGFYPLWYIKCLIAYLFSGILSSYAYSSMILFY